ncbi:nucleoside-diphosphate-sugar epimerase [Breoghania corrubedonensis]|uniref:Nucleoside-diphosphate-sugar epimerase n=1 Tax=Breoghania corrubedonensis TaxID=665038 RepID=A0A2T5UW74_9HYPH|nr:NAD(P)-dependent oxidoreductase [Breoghania corrubedonensis]PTW55765.1 nucleoside-diphosphate-sugar epimerase [Breoghania corrubedonensis]
MTSSTAIVFGGAGFIGTHLLEHLVAQGHHARVVCADIRDPKRAVAGVEYLTCDVRETIDAQALGAASIVYNLAAVHTTPGYEDWEYYWTNVLGATHVCDYARAAGCQTMVFTSSISVYGPCEEPKDETGLLEPNSAYGRSKYQAEEIHRAWRRAGEGRTLRIARPAVVFGPGEGGNFTRLAALLKKGRMVYPGRKETIKACGYVGELIRMFDFALARGEAEIIFNFAYRERYTTEDICNAFRRVADFKAPLGVIPLPVMMAGGLAFEVLGLLGKKTSVNRARVMKLVHSTNVVPGVLPAMGYEYETDLEEALRRWQAADPSGEFV